MRSESEEVRRLRRLWDEHIHRPFFDLGDDPSSQEVALYAAWLGGELGDPVPSYVARLIAIEDILISLPVDK